MHPILLVYTALAFFVVRIFMAVYSDRTSPLRKVHGPLLARFSRLWYFRSVWKGHAHDDNIQLHRKYARLGEFYAPVVRLGPDLYSITRPEKAAYGIGSKMPKSTWYDGWKHPSPDRWVLFTDRDIKRHAETRKKFQNLYSLSSLLRYEPFVDDAQGIFQQRLTEMAASPDLVDLHHWLQCYAFDVIGNITYGQRFGFLDEGKDIQGCMAALQSSMFYSTLVGVYSWAHPFLFRLMEKLPGSGAAARLYIMQIVRQNVVQREKDRADPARKDQPSNEDSPRDFLDLIIDAKEDPDKKVTPYHVFMMGLSNVFAGSDTTAVSLSSIVYYLIKTPHALKALRVELDQAVKDGRIQPSRIPFKEAQDLPYLQACIKEGLRLNSATGLPLWRVVPAGGAEMMGHYFPEGTVVGINTWVLHYDEDVWGRDAAQFRPERWIEADPEKLKSMENNMIAFGLGSRTCLGRHISYLEICKVIPMIMLSFDFELRRPNEHWDTANYWFVRPTNFHVNVKQRQTT